MLFRSGCIIEEGNRRVFERLKRAEKEIEEGHLEPAWALVRRSLERLYLIAQLKFGPEIFDPRSWQDQPADYMWGNGAGEIIEGKVPGAGKEVYDILKKSVAGSHEKPPRGETDLRNGIKYIRNILGELRLGG